MSRSPVTTLLQIILALSIATILIASPLYVIVTPAYPGLQYRQASFPESIRFTRAERTRLAETIWRYTRGDVSLEEMASMQTDAGQVALLPSETQHLVDVKRVVQAFYLAHGIALLLAIVAAALIRNHTARLVRALYTGTTLAIGLLAVIGISALINFDVFFTLFHGVFFESGTWTFAYEDTLIQLYPLKFWTNAVLHYMVLIGALSAVVIGIARVLTRRPNRETLA